MNPLIDAQPGVEDDHDQREDHRIESDLLDFEMRPAADPHGGQDHTRLPGTSGRR
jgi:hypothetical protein